MGTGVGLHVELGHVEGSRGADTCLRAWRGIGDVWGET